MFVKVGYLMNPRKDLVKLFHGTGSKSQIVSLKLSSNIFLNRINPDVIEVNKDKFVRNTLHEELNTKVYHILVEFVQGHSF